VIIGFETSLIYLSDEKAIFALAQWLQWRETTLERSSVGADLDVVGSRLERNRTEKWWQKFDILKQEIIANLSDDEIVDLEVLFRIGRGPAFGEHYEELLIEVIQVYRLIKSRSERAHCTMIRLNLLENIVKGCRIVGRPTLAAKLQALVNDERPYSNE